MDIFSAQLLALLPQKPLLVPKSAPYQLDATVIEDAFQQETMAAVKETRHTPLQLQEKRDGICRMKNYAIGAVTGLCTT